ncbi:MAG: hypothetical protein AAGG09_07280 [Pseudomonadota bacterium]
MPRRGMVAVFAASAFAIWAAGVAPALADEDAGANKVTGATPTAEEPTQTRDDSWIVLARLALVLAVVLAAAN